jgi:peptide/nickel transport system permease protein
VSVADAVTLTGARARRRRVARVRFLRRPVAVAALAVVVLFVVTAALAPWLTPYNPNATNFNLVLAHSSWSHPLGTDELGRDVLSRIIMGARASLIVGLAATLLAMLVAVPVGIAAGYFGGWLDTVVARLTDVLLAFPSVILAVGLAAILGPSLRNATIALAIAGIPHFIRVTRGETLALREQYFVKAAVVSGAGGSAIVFRHLLPNMASVLLVFATVHIPVAIIGEATLSFLGLGVRPPTASWGVMLTEGESFLGMTPRLMLYPGIAIMLVALAFNLLGDGLRDALDPKTIR